MTRTQVFMLRLPVLPWRNQLSLATLREFGLGATVRIGRSSWCGWWLHAYVSVAMLELTLDIRQK